MRIQIDGNYLVAAKAESRSPVHSAFRNGDETVREGDFFFFCFFVRKFKPVVCHDVVIIQKFVIGQAVMIISVKPRRRNAFGLPEKIFVL